MKNNILELDKFCEQNEDHAEAENSFYSNESEKVVYISDKYRRNTEVYLDTLFDFLIEDGQEKRFIDLKLKKYKDKTNWNALKNDRIKESYALTFLVSEIDRSTSRLYEKLEKIEHDNQLIVERLNQELEEIKDHKYWHDDCHQVRYANISLIDGFTCIIKRIAKKIRGILKNS
jgi:hypothetical protein